MNCAWIGVDHHAPAGKFAYFRLDAELPKDCHLTAQFTAAAHYRLWINGRPVCSGPCMGDQHVWYYDEVDLTPYLIPGVNRFAAQVICLDPAAAIDRGSENASLVRMIVPDHRHRFAFGAQAGEIDLSTGKADWRVLVDESAKLQKDKIVEWLGPYSEIVDYHQTPVDWKNADCGSWPAAVRLESVEHDNYYPVVGLTKRYPVQPRPIPMLFEREEAFAREIMTDTSLLQKGKIQIPPHTAFEAVLDAGQVKVTHPAFRVSGGDGAQMEITYFEKFQKNGENFRRDDWKRGEIIGIKDLVTLNGQEITYEPFFVRTFRFVRLRLTTGDQGATLHLPTFRRTGYPLTEDSDISSSASWVHDLWRMCAETLQNCMLSTYMDCPYYEQLQYIMDTRLQVLFHLTLSHDTQMARKALEDFHRSILPWGLLPGKYPTAYLQVISTFSLHYIFMVWEYYAHTGDASVLRAYRADCDRILTYFENHLTDRGLMGHPGFWPFVDWQPAWDNFAGVPTALKEGESTIISLMYAFALEQAAKINEFSGRPGMAQEYQARKGKVCDAVQALCWDEKRQMYREGPAYPQFTQHAQAWAVLCGLGDEGCIRAAASDPDVLPVTFSTANEWFRALEKTGLYKEYGKQSLQPWIDLIALDCKTCPETPVNSRSENHAWSAQPMLELIRGVAGIRQEGVGWRQVVIAPCLMDLPDLRGTAATPKGDIRFSYTEESYSITLPAGVTGTFRHPDGRLLTLHEGDNAGRMSP
ncbi:MAG: family 78 glycoside hydrolase catalytic domain [Clostridia bacterium]|nr:family 78 glycoside hydrolase catalytic domain [Clostridia bacterium]